MKKLFASFGWALLLFPLISFAGIRNVAEIGTALYDSENRQVGPFNTITSAGAFDVFVTMGTKESLRLEGDKDVISKIETVVENGNLKIRTKKNAERLWGSSFGKVRVYITAKALKGVHLSGSGNIKVDGNVKANDFSSRISGSGTIRLNLNAEKYSAAVSGSGELIVSGSAEIVDIAISGSGDFQGEKLRTSNANIKISGSGDVSIHADEILNAAVSGSGNIMYAGNAQVNSRTSGSGKVKRL